MSTAHSIASRTLLSQHLLEEEEEEDETGWGRRRRRRYHDTRRRRTRRPTRAPTQAPTYFGGSTVGVKCRHSFACMHGVMPAYQTVVLSRPPLLAGTGRRLLGRGRRRPFGRRRTKEPTKNPTKRPTKTPTPRPTQSPASTPAPTPNPTKHFPVCVSELVGGSLAFKKTGKLPTQFNQFIKVTQ